MTDPEFTRHLEKASALRDWNQKVELIPENETEMACIEIDDEGYFFDFDKMSKEGDFLQFAVEAWQMWPEILRRLKGRAE